MRVHYCYEAGCHETIPIEMKYCKEHYQLHKPYHNQSRANKLASDREYTQSNRDPESIAFYQSKQWQAVRNYVFNRDVATCQSCGNAIDNRKIVDHIVRRDLCSDPLDTDNLWTLCYRCHAIKTKGEQSILKSRNGKNKLRHLGKKWWRAYLSERIHN